MAKKAKKAAKKTEPKAKKLAPQRRKAEGGAKRDAKGRFVKGASGNPGGMTAEVAATLASIKALAAEKSPDAVNALHEIATDGEDERARVQAAVALLDRAFGKPRQELELSGPEGGAVEVETRGPAVLPDQVADVLAVLASSGVVPVRDEEAGEE